MAVQDKFLQKAQERSQTNEPIFQNSLTSDPKALVPRINYFISIDKYTNITLYFIKEILKSFLRQQGRSNNA